MAVPCGKRFPLEGLAVQPRAEMSGQAKGITWVVQATGMRAANRAKLSRHRCETRRCSPVRCGIRAG
jgi:hypothetical protein